MAEKSNTPIQEESSFSGDFTHMRRYAVPTIHELMNLIVAKIPGEWNKVGIQLKIPPEQLNGLKSDISLGGDPSNFFQKTLEIWINNPSPGAPHNWETILTALVSPSVGQCTLARSIAQELQKKEHEDERSLERETDNLIKVCQEDNSEDAETESNSSGYFTEDTLKYLCGCGECSLEKIITEGCDCPGSLQRFPLLDIQKLPKVKSQQYLYMLAKEAEIINDEFASLCDDVCQSMIKRDISVQRIITFLRISKRFTIVTRKTELHQRLDRSKTIEEVFAVLSNICSWFNHHPVGALIKKFGTNDDKNLYDKFTEETLMKYLKRSVTEIPKDSFGPEDIEGSGKFRLKIDSLSTHENVIGDHIFVLKGKVAEALNIAIEDLHICSISKGCVEVEFLVPLLTLNELFPLSPDQSSALADITIEGSQLKVRSIIHGDTHYDLFHTEPTSTINLASTTTGTDIQTITDMSKLYSSSGASLDTEYRFPNATNSSEDEPVSKIQMPITQVKDAQTDISSNIDDHRQQLSKLGNDLANNPYPGFLYVCEECLKNDTSMTLAELKCHDYDVHQKEPIKFEVVAWDPTNDVLVPIRHIPMKQPMLSEFTLCSIKNCNDENCEFPHNFLEMHVWNYELKKVREESKKIQEKHSQRSRIVLKSSSTIDDYDDYKEKFKKALGADRLEVNAKLTIWLVPNYMDYGISIPNRCNGKYDLKVLDLIPEWFQSKSRQPLAYVAYIDIEEYKAQYGLEESDYVRLIYAPNETEMCKVKIAPQNFRNTKPILYLLLSKTDMDKLREFPFYKFENGIVFQNTKILFEAKHDHYNSLHKALLQLPDFMIQKFLPSNSLKHSTFAYSQARTIPGECEISQISVDDDHRVRLLQHILDCPPDVPIIISGAFGTGKTTLLARATYEFVQNRLSFSSQTRILICTHHTSNADVYMEQYLIPAFQGKDDVQIVRVMRESKKEEAKFNNVQYVEFTNLEISNKLEEAKCVVFVTTYMTSLKLVNQIKSKSFYFTHIILDEAAQVCEPEAVAPLCLGNEDTKIIMAGDFKQVGPTVSIQATGARRSGLNISLLERLWKLYREIGGSLLHYTGELNRNYRCHPEITKLLSHLLYKDRDPIADSKFSKCVVTHPRAPFPCVFYSCDCSKFAVVSDADSSKRKVNKKDADVHAHAVVLGVKFYFEKWPEEWRKIGLNMKDVCIISASRNQLNLVRQRLSEDEGVPQGAEYLTSYNIQGFEFQAILLSTYESLDENGMPHDPTKSLCNPHVFNTVVSRSRALVVAVGDPLKLLETEKVMGSKERCWKEYLKCCLEHNSLHFPKGFSQAKEQFIQKVIQSNV